MLVCIICSIQVLFIITTCTYNISSSCIPAEFHNICIHDIIFIIIILVILVTIKLSKINDYQHNTIIHY